MSSEAEATIAHLREVLQKIIDSDSGVCLNEASDPDCGVCSVCLAKTALGIELVHGGSDQYGEDE